MAAPLDPDPAVPAAPGASADPATLPDDEFAGIPTARPRRSPLVAVAVTVLAGVLLAHQLPATRYALSSRTPRDLGDARHLDASALRDDTLVAVRGLPDYRNALLFEPRGDNYRRAFYRLLGTGSRLWVRADQTSTRTRFTSRVVGRLRRFDALPYAAQIRAYYRDKVEVTRQLDVAAFARALTPKGPPATVVDRTGEPFAVHPGDPKRDRVKVVVSDDEEILVTLSKDQFPLEEDARHELARLGAPISSGRELRTGFEFVAHVPVAQRNAYLARLDAEGFRYALRRLELSAPLSGLRPAPGGGLSVPLDDKSPILYEVEGDHLLPEDATHAAVFPWSRIEALEAASPVDIPADAWLLTENERPADYTWILALDVVLLGFLAFNLWLVARTLRGR